MAADDDFACPSCGDASPVHAWIEWSSATRTWLDRCPSCGWEFDGDRASVDGGRLTPDERKELMAVAHDLRNLADESLTLLREENAHLRAALQDAPDRTCESPEAQAWRTKHADALKRISDDPPR